MDIFDALFITTRRNHGGGVEAGIAPMYYLMPVGAGRHVYVTYYLSCGAAVLGVVVVVLFEMWCGNFSVSARLEQFKSERSPASSFEINIRFLLPNRWYL